MQIVTDEMIINELQEALENVSKMWREKRDRCDFLEERLNETRTQLLSLYQDIRTASSDVLNLKHKLEGVDNG